MTSSLLLSLYALSALAQTPLPKDHPKVEQPAANAPLPADHPPVANGGRPAPTAEQLLQQLDATLGLKEREKSFEIAAALGKLYFTNGRPQDAVPYFEQAEAKAKGVRALYLAQVKRLGKRPVPSAEEARCGFGPDTALEAMASAAEQRAKAGDAPGAAACARAALAPALEVEGMRASALVLAGDSKAALAAYEDVLEVAPTHEEAQFGHAALLYETRGEDLKALESARKGFEAFLAAHPQSPRAALARKLGQMTQQTIDAGGRKKYLASRAEDRKVRLSQVLAEAPPAQPPAAGAPGMDGAPPPDAPPALTKEMLDAVKNTERTPELEAGLARLVEEGEEHLARGRYQEALGAYTRVMPFQPDNGRARAGMAWALVGLKRPMAERVWSVAVSGDPAAVEKLGDTLKAKNDAAGAKALWQRLDASAPDYPGKKGLEAKLRE
ncbi:tetratricopeptide repeat protein [Aggregicoccus sp. 17bor-14]|uniref:tetratricopeptide repeat protein n=1 Tax=Myxococcaceae TaxID=31 RepID=UPI00129C1198|nr:MULTISPECIES: tetratricopeptide repeat protein [Myxococcaceae]MBF5044591.1 tetratricopeptide repeat protein [Simulacricoccus sp. 17bor-14]MRI90335.1 tetratricopeptide repeat protein [Aggregicoccus sp. 17bor-14]